MFDLSRQPATATAPVDAPDSKGAVMHPEKPGLLPVPLAAPDSWILAELSALIQTVHSHMESFDCHLAIAHIQFFLHHLLFDYYLVRFLISLSSSITFLLSFFF